MTGLRVVAHPDACSFLRRAEAWLMLREDENNLALSLAGALGDAPPQDGAGGYLFATVEVDGEVVGCGFRVPPHKLCLTQMPVEGAAGLAEVMAERYGELPGVRGPADAARAVAASWGRLKGVAVRPATPDDLPIAHAWGEGFAADAGEAFRTSEDTRVGWIERGALYLWEDGALPVSMGVVTGRTRHGARIGYVYTPRERRGRGYAGALTAALSRLVLERGARFCVLYTDLANATSNALYPRVGYRPLCEELELEFAAPR